MKTRKRMYKGGYPIILQMFPGIKKNNNTYTITCTSGDSTIFKVYPKYIYIDILSKCNDISGTEILEKIIAISIELNKPIRLIDASMVNTGKCIYSLAYFYILLTGQSWYNRYGFISKHHAQNVDHNASIRELTLDEFIRLVNRYKKLNVSDFIKYGIHKDMKISDIIRAFYEHRSKPCIPEYELMASLINASKHVLEYDTKLTNGMTDETIVSMYFPTSRYEKGMYIIDCGITFSIEETFIYITRILCHDELSSILDKFISLAQDLGMETIDLVDTMVDNPCQYSTYFHILLTGQSWYNSQGFVSAEYDNEVEHNNRIRTNTLRDFFDILHDKYKKLGKFINVDNIMDEFLVYGISEDMRINDIMSKITDCKLLDIIIEGSKYMLDYDKNLNYIVK